MYQENQPKTVDAHKEGAKAIRRKLPSRHMLADYQVDYRLFTCAVCRAVFPEGVDPLAQFIYDNHLDLRCIAIDCPRPLIPQIDRVGTLSTSLIFGMPTQYWGAFYDHAVQLNVVDPAKDIYAQYRWQVVQWSEPAAPLVRGGKKVSIFSLAFTSNKGSVYLEADDDFSFKMKFDREMKSQEAAEFLARYVAGETLYLPKPFQPPPVTMVDADE